MENEKDYGSEIISKLTELDIQLTKLIRVLKEYGKEFSDSFLS